VDESGFLGVLIQKIPELILGHSHTSDGDMVVVALKGVESFGPGSRRDARVGIARPRMDVPRWFGADSLQYQPVRKLVLATT
jgi:hypothetical protein